MEMSYVDLLDKCESIYNDYKITTNPIENVELYTREQSASKMWFQQRAGRVTASRLKAAFVLTSLSHQNHLFEQFVTQKLPNSFPKLLVGVVNMSRWHTIPTKNDFQECIQIFSFPSVD